jgi:hypothetical protein
MSTQHLVQNYYEKLVFEALMLKVPELSIDADQFSDIACVALNNLPSRYYRHEVDMMFYMPPHEHEIINASVEKAVSDAILFVRSHVKN